MGCYINWQTAQESFSMVRNHQNGLLLLVLLCIPRKDERVGLERYSQGICPSYNPFSTNTLSTAPPHWLYFHFLYWLTGFSPSPTTKEVKKLAFKPTVMQGELKTAHSPWVSFVCMLAPATSHLICTESESKFGVRLEFGNSVLAESGPEKKIVFLVCANSFWTDPWVYNRKRKYCWYSLLLFFSSKSAELGNQEMPAKRFWGGHRNRSMLQCCFIYG